jgi:hypothetical protein
MSPAERGHAVDYLERTKAALLEAAGTLTDTQWRFKPTPEEWSPAECVEHLAIVEAFLLKNIQQLGPNPADSSDVLAGCAGKEEIIAKRVPRRGVKAMAPEPVRPTGRFSHPADLLALFSATRDRTLDYARTTSDPIRTHTFPHFVFGPLDGYQWLIFIAAHTERHLAQMLEVTEAEARARRIATGL